MGGEGWEGEGGLQKSSGSVRRCIVTLLPPSTPPSVAPSPFPTSRLPSIPFDHPCALSRRPAARCAPSCPSRDTRALCPSFCFRSAAQSIAGRPFGEVPRRLTTARVPPIGGRLPRTALGFRRILTRDVDTFKFAAVG